MCDCRIRKHGFKPKQLFTKSGPHIVYKYNFVCPLCCDPRRKFTSHDKNVYQYGIQFLECLHCHNYIRQTDYKQSVIKEFFFVLEGCVVMESNSIIFEKQYHEDIILPFFVFENELQLIKKIQTYTLLS